MVNQTPDRWKRIEEAPSYEVSDKGEVRNRATMRILRPSITRRGYKKVNLRDAGQTITRSVDALRKGAFD